MTYEEVQGTFKELLSQLKKTPQENSENFKESFENFQIKSKENSGNTKGS